MEIRKKARFSSALIAGLFAIGVVVVPMAKADQVTLQVEHYYTGGPQVQAFATAIGDCAATYGAKINITAVPGDQLDAKVLQQSSSKTLPDLLMLDNPDIASFASTGALLPLAPFGITAAGFYPGIIAASTYKGKLYSLQPITNTISLFYNKDLFAAAGITPPTTWSSLKRDAKKLTHGNNYGLAFSAKADFEGTWQFLPFMWTAGASEDNINSPQMASAIQLWVDLFKAKSVSKSALTWSQSDVNDQFIAGKAAMMINGPWQYPALKAVPSLHWGVAPIPTPTAGGVSVSPLGGEGWTLPDTGNTTNEAIAAKVLVCLNSDANQMKIGLVGGVIPTKIKLAKAYVKQAPDMAAFVKQVATARARTGIVGENWPAAATKIYKAFQLALVGGKTAAQAAATAAAGQ